MSSEASAAKWRSHERWLALAVFAAAFLLYSNTLGHRYALDDVAVIQQNKFTQRGLAGIPDLLTTFYWQGYWEHNFGLYRPLSLITFAIEWQFFPANPFVGHLTHVLLYAASMALVFVFLRKILRAVPSTVLFTAALLFTAHPVHTEVVCNLKSRDEILCFLFFTLTALCFLEHVEHGKKAWLALAAGAYFLCVLSKEGGLAYLAVLPLAAWFFTGLSWRAIAVKTVPFAVVAAVFLCMRAYAIGRATQPVAPITYLDNSLLAAPDALSRFATAVFVLGDYLKLLVYPHPLSYDYSFAQIPVKSIADVQVLATVVVCLALLAWSFRGARRKDPRAFFVLFSFITIAMVSNVFRPIADTKAERFLYAPLLGFSTCLALLLVEHLRKPAVLWGVVGSIVAAYSWGTVRRNPAWEDDFTLFASDVSSAPGSARTHYNYATVYMDRVALKETDPEKRARLLQLPIRELEEAARIDPKFHDTFYNLGLCLCQAGDYQRAAESCRRAVELDPRDGASYHNMGAACFWLERFDEAITALKESIDLGYESEDSYNLLGSAYLQTGDVQTAIAQFEKALAKNPRQPDVLGNLASARAMLGDYDEAIRYLQESARLRPDDARVYHSLGMAYEAKGDARTAAEYYEKARSLGLPEETAPRDR